jgi:hypothetical protein
MATEKVRINRAPVLTLWATVVAERMGYERAAALTLGKAVAGLNAQSKGRRLGIYEARPEEDGDEARTEKAAAPKTVTVLGRAVPVVDTQQGQRAAIKGDAIDPASVERYLRSKFGARLGEVEGAMQELAGAFDPDELAHRAYDLYEAFRPEIPEGVKGWGAAGELDLEAIRRLAP